MKISVICPSEIAYRRFMPAIKKSTFFDYVGVGYHSANECYNYADNIEQHVQNSKLKAEKFRDEFGGIIYNSYEDVIVDNNVDAIYIPLPPAFHFTYALKALKMNKHVLLEKPATLCSKDMTELINFAKEKELSLHENFMFVYHSQLDYIINKIHDGEIGDVRLFRISFGFPFRGSNDFRYNRQLGGGALADAGSYTLKLASYLLGNKCRIDSATVSYIKGTNVEIFGQGVLINDLNQVAQVSFGMDNDYKCDLEIWGSKGTLFANRIFTAPVGYKPIIAISKNGQRKSIELESDDTFYKSIDFFSKCIIDKNIRVNHYNEVKFQADLFEEFRKKAGIEW